MLYLSPFILITTLTKEHDFSNFAYTKIKRKIQAQFELQNSQAIEINGVPVNKSDALKLLEELKDELLFNYHLLVFDNKSLLNFLQKGDDHFFENASPFTDEAFKTWISPYFAHQYNHLLYEKLKTNSVKTVLIRPPESFMDIQFLDKAYTKSYRSLKNEIAEINEVLSLDRSRFIKETKRRKTQFNPVRLKVINALPDYFQNLRDDYSEVCTQLAIELNNEHRLHIIAFAYIKFAYHLKTNEFLRQEVKRIYDDLYFNVQNVGSQANGKRIHWGWVVLFIIVLGVRLTRCGSHMSSNNVKIPEQVLTIQKLEKSMVDLNHIEKNIRAFHQMHTDSSLNYTAKDTSAYNYSLGTPYSKRSKSYVLENRTKYDAVFFAYARADNTFLMEMRITKVEAGNQMHLDLPALGEISTLCYLGDNWSTDTCAFCSPVETEFGSVLRNVKVERVSLEELMQIKNGGVFTKNAHIAYPTKIPVDSDVFFVIEDKWEQLTEN